MQQRAKAEEGQSLSTEDWLKVARETLIREGVDKVKVDRLAKACKVTRGGFYWRFKSRSDLLDQLLEDWRTTNTAPFLAAIKGPGRPEERFAALFQLWIDERAYRPDYDTAVRNWSVHSRKVANVVHEVDEIRMAALKELFLDAGYSRAEAEVRGRITYFTQVGYYAMGLRETARRRMEMSELYYHVLTGFSDTAPVHKVTPPAPAKTKKR